MTAPLTGPEAADAIKRCSHALASRPDYLEAARLLAALLQRYEINAGTDVSPRGLQAAFAFPNVDRQALCDGALAYLKCHPPLAEVLARGRADGWNGAAALLSRKGARLLRDRLFAAALSHGLVADIEIEFLLTALRRRLLLTPSLLKARPVYEFACVLIRQCLNNEYVFYADEEERARLGELTVDIDAMFQGNGAAGGRFLLWSLYLPFHETLGIEARETNRVSPRALRAVLREELEARRSEAAQMAGLRRLTAVTDETSRLVAGQYTIDPYPRWLSLQAPEPGGARDNMRGHFSDDALAVIDGPCDVLIAGAGTGRQAVHSAIGYGTEARVLAMDLSAPSLAYGARMAEVLVVGNLSFAVGDILRLGTDGDRFDVIECVGVLHHMADPYEGWRALLDQLRPGGLMLIGLYSAVSRRVIEALSKDPDWPGPDADDDGLRAYRRKLMDRAPGDQGFLLTESIDFFSKSGFRDLALHVSEQTSSIPEIGEFMTTHGLEFHGFSLPDDTLRAYGDAFPGDEPPGTLDHWWAFEQDNPQTFSGMYLFWCRG
ncbi:MAG: class I SAM-dependent methyltransferase [Alphaproteobacteria bacterium]|nr:class I SAM-dependent methyltransferase [Alphaproteobacteria bacterium]MDP6830795.1 class I SAM-dependent methyltransferase [Alphaproteobacteria bacterium]MDP6876007.1 class I SAM-dependent methyltransferase [Alphaproteobacteria bacterium]